MNNEHAALAERLSALTPEQRALLARRLKKEPGAAKIRPEDRLSLTKEKPLRIDLDADGSPVHIHLASNSQQRMWFLHKCTPESPVYHSPIAFHLRGRVQVKALEAAVRALIERQESLRTTFALENRQLVQRIGASSKFQLEHLSVMDMADSPAADPKVAAASWLQETACLPFDLAEAPPFRVTLISIGSEEHLLLVVLHHIITDGWSMSNLCRELSALYSATVEGSHAALPELPVQYADYSGWQRRYLESSAFEKQSDYWKSKLAGDPEPLDIPTDSPRPVVDSFHGGECSSELDAGLVTRLKAVAQKQNATLFMVLLAAFKVLLHRYTGQTDVPVGVPIANRSRSEVEGLIGLFANTLVMRTEVSVGISFDELLERVKTTALDAYEHQEMPFDLLVRLVPTRRETNRSPFFQTCFALRDFAGIDLQLTGLQVTPLDISTHTAKFDLSLTVSPASDGLTASMEFNSDLFSKDRVSRMLEHWRSVLREVAADSTRSISELSLLLPRERQRLLVEWNATAQDFPADKCLHELFNETAARFPESVAVRFRDDQLTYRELDRQSTRLAHELRGLGVGPEVRVGLCVERSARMLVAMLGILKAGGAYLPLDPLFPPSRMAFILEDAGAKLLVTERSLQNLCPRFSGLRLFLDDELTGEVSVEKNPKTPPTNAAYVIYTSGSTGRPKGVVIEHRSAVNLLHGARTQPGINASDVQLAFGSIAFDVSVSELFAPLLVGACVVIAPDDVRMNGPELAALLVESGATILDATPAIWRLLLQTGWKGDKKLKAQVGGDALAPGLAADLLDRCGEVWNLYGPTETTVSCLAARIESTGEITIGKPLANTQAYVVDRNGQLVPIGVVGELWIGGAGVARGYLNRPELTAERFIPNPFSASPGSRVYKTGDLVRWRPDEKLEFIGRADHQVKIRGNRIELGEIQFVLTTHSGIDACAVIVQPARDGEKELVAFLVKNESTDLSISSLRPWLAEKLPGHMIPSRFVVIDALPLNTNGKFDLKALSQLDGTELDVGTDQMAPRNQLEQELLEIWQEVLKRKNVGVRDNFFDLGGHSLLAVHMCLRIASLLKREMPLRLFLENPTIEGLALRLANSKETLPAATAIEIVDRRQPLPMSAAEEQMWLLHQTTPDPATYNLPVAWRWSGPVDREKIVLALQGIMERHEVLRTALVQAENDLLQRITPSSEIALPWTVIDLSQAAPEEKEAMLDDTLRKEVRRPFDLTQPPLWRATWIELGLEECVLLCNFHHGIIDDWSLKIFSDELEKIYASDGDIARAGLPELPVQYADFTSWQRRQSTGTQENNLLVYWTEQLRGIPPVLEIPTDRIRTLPPVGAGAVHYFPLSDSVVAGLRALARRERTTVWTLLMAAFQVWLSRCTGQDDIVVSTPIANRDRPETKALLGCFLNNLPIRSRLHGGQSFIEVLHDVRETSLEAFDHSHLSFEKILASATRERGGPPPEALYRIMFVLMEEEEALPQLGHAHSRPVPLTTATSKNDLTLGIDAVGQKMAARLEYASDLFSEERIASFARQLTELFQSIVADPRKPIAELNLLPETERQQIVVELNRTEHDYPRDQCVHTLFEEQAGRTPEATAVVFAGQPLTYRELNQRANQLAHHLRKLGVGTGTLVGICVERSLDMVVGLLGILKAGAAYVPLDPNYPKDRLAFVLEDATAKVLLTQSHLVESMPACSAHLLRMDTDWPDIASESDANPANTTTPEQLAYVIYTSGSTGLPKGVEIPHRAFVNFLASMQASPGLSADDVLVAVTTISFDIAGLEIFLPLVTGAKLVLLPRDEAADGQRLIHHLKENNATILQATPVTWRMLLEAKWPGNPQLKMLCGGEPLPRELAAQLLEKGGELWNMYGPTETTIWSSAARVTRDNATIHIGRPIANTELYILDSHLQPVPIGMAGELHIGGDGLARGYHHRPELTAEKFIPHPLQPDAGTRLYKTGDSARFLPDGNIEHLGRLDHQVKLRGFRVELGEIEHVLDQHPGVQASVVVAREDAPGDKRLVAYIVNRGTVISSSDLRDHLHGKLPDYMVPAAFVTLPTLPLTPNGKVDRKALPKPDAPADAPECVYVPPTTPTEIAMAAIWCEVFGLKQVGIHDNFYDLGGHSLLAVRLMGKINKSLGLHLSLRVLLLHPTIEKLAIVAREESGSTFQQSPVSSSAVQAKGHRLPLFFLHGDWLAGDFYCGRLSMQMGEDQPFYALPPYCTGESRVVTLPEMAAHHLAAIREQSPHGPYFLGGYCIGATVAIEIAHQLMAQGEKVAGLLLIDPAQSASAWPREIWPFIDKLGTALHWNLRKKIDHLEIFGVAIVRWLRFSPREKLTALCNRLGLARFLPPRPRTPESENDDRDAENLSSMDYAVYVLAYRLYKLKPLSVPATIYLPAETPPPPHSWLRQARRMLPLVTIETVPGDHRTCLVDHSAALGEQMKKTLRALSDVIT